MGKNRSNGWGDRESVNQRIQKKSLYIVFVTFLSKVLLQADRNHNATVQHLRVFKHFKKSLNEQLKFHADLR